VLAKLFEKRAISKLPPRPGLSFPDAGSDRLSRIYGGMHYRNSTHKGAILGKQVSHFATRHFFRPAPAEGQGTGSE
jgi:hypothetical protein